ncbi:MAG: methyltransferase domain-containing protein [Pseudomonadota bacterium]|mgnify:CR=1 FL=1|uniref:class I SAM-dependent methyltransferase n=1 Tax=Phenylobacterium sp. TaxID=1871053 RepID=UPI0025EC4838|nr:class I SAM-dependent methyltransferase [Phenylobacterium sp.]MBT9473631.1 methyltransferase domain-containing protein [Phenylobacterium sp.]
MPAETASIWNDREYLREEQYRDSSKLAARANLHGKYGRGDWFAWVAAQPTWPVEGRVLELGCGAGWFWASAAPHAPAGLELTLTDLSPGMVDEAVRRTRGLSRWPVEESRAADASALPFADASFDVVQALHMLYHLPSPAKGVDEILRVLRPGGLAVIATNGRDTMAELFALNAAVFGGAARDETIDAFSLESAEPILRERFAQVELRAYPDTLRITDPADVYGYHASSPPGDAATPDQAAALRRVIDEAFARGGGTLTVTKSVGVFLCRKAG